MKARITTKVEGYNGLSACVAFADGVAEAEISQAQLDYFKANGYKVQILKADKPETPDKSKANTKAPKGNGKDADKPETPEEGGDAPESESNGDKPEDKDAK